MFHLKKNQNIHWFTKGTSRNKSKSIILQKYQYKTCKMSFTVFVKPVLNKIHIDNRISQWHTFKVKQKTL